MDAAIIQNKHQQLVWKTLMQLMQEGDKGSSITSRCLFPIHPLTLKVQSTKNRLALPALGLMHFALDLRSLPASLHIGLVAKMRFIDKQDGDILLVLLQSDGADNLVHPTFFFSELGACKGIVLAKRL